MVIGGIIMKTMLTLMVLLLAATAVLADGIPDLDGSYAVCAYDGPGQATVMNFPDGAGSSFTESLDPDGNVVDATITLVVLDWNDFPIPDFPMEDIWLESADGGLVPCMGGSTADSNTDMNGETKWVNPLRAGGSSEALCQVLINGNAIYHPVGLPISFNSPDINADGQVNIADLGLFSTDYYNNYAFRSDFYRDGVLNLADVACFAQGLATSCP